MFPGALATCLSQHLLGYPLTYDTWVSGSVGEDIVCSPASLVLGSAQGLWGLMPSLSSRAAAGQPGQRPARRASLASCGQVEPWA